MFQTHVKLLILLLCYSEPCLSQVFKPILSEYYGDSSFYALAKINDNEFWTGGEHGVLKRIDSQGNVKHIPFPEDKSIFKIDRFQQTIYLACNDGTLFLFDLKTSQFRKQNFPSLKHKTIYDISILNDGSVVACGGSEEIANGKRGIPRGFVAHLNIETSDAKIIWKSWRKFAWSIAKENENKVYISTYNGFKSSIYSLNQTFELKKKMKIKGLVHKILFFKNQLIYSGSKSHNIREDGIFGSIGEKKSHHQIKGSGCIWSFTPLENKWLGLANTRTFVKIDTGSNQITQNDVKSPYPFYQLMPIGRSRFIVVGHGRKIYWIE